MPESESVVITGGTGGMGLATARILGRDRHVVLSGRNTARLDTAVSDLKLEGVAATPVACDVTSRESVDALFAAAARTGRVTAVVHAAGVSPNMGAPELIVAVNALGTVNVTEGALAVAAEGSVLVNVASVAGHMLPAPLVPRRTYKLALSDPARFAARLTAAAGRAPARLRPGMAYTMSKAFVIWYSRKRAAAFGARGAQVLSVSPGAFASPMVSEEAEGADALMAFAALKRLGDLDEVAELLAFCASGKCGYLTGTDILCDGGVRAGITVRDMITRARARGL